MAWRNLWRNRRRTLITLASLALGVLLAVLFTALQDRSFADFIDTAARMGSGHVTVQHPGYLDRPTLTLTLADAERERQLALAVGGARQAVPRISGQALVASADDNAGAYFIAYDPTLEDSTTLSVLDGIQREQSLRHPRDRGLLLGEKFAERLRVRIGDKLVYTLTDRRGELVSGMGRLVGVVRTGTPSVDGALMLLPIDTLREVVGYGPREATQVAVFLSDARQSRSYARRLGARLGPAAAAVPWDELRPELAAFIAMKVGGARFLELVILLLIAAGIFNTLLVSVLERGREFGIMLAIGFSRAQLFRLVMWESLWLGLLGLALGAVLVAGPYAYLSQYGLDLSIMTGSGHADVGGVGFDPRVRVGIYPENLLIIGLTILGATLVTGLYPARRAGKLEAVDAIRLV
jgi:ABC-type lipoprotein release transport system permease subunit